MTRFIEIERETKETKIKLFLRAEADSPGLCGSSGIGFFDHMLNAFAFHGGFELRLEMSGDLHVDCHHTVEDVGIVLGAAFGAIIGQDKNIARFAHECVPMDESLAMCSVDLGGRAYLVFNAEFTPGSIGGYDAQMTKEFFRALSHNMLSTIHINLQYGENDHHKTEAIFKAAARAMKKALAPAGDHVASTKGII